MKRRITALVAFSMLAGLFFTACEKDKEEPKTEEKEKVLYPLKITEYDEDGEVDDVTLYEYNASKQLTKIDYGGNDYETYEYFNGKLILKKEYEEGECIVYDSLEYNTEGKLVKIWKFEHLRENQKPYYDILKYNAKGLVSQMSSYSGYDELVEYCTYECDENGNIINIKEYGIKDEVISNEVIFEGVYEYDDKNHVGKALNIYLRNKTQINNIVKRTHSYSNSEEKEVYVSMYSIEYNEDNYPVKIIEDDGEYEIIEYKEL